MSLKFDMPPALVCICLAFVQTSRLIGQTAQFRSVEFISDRMGWDRNGSVVWVGDRREQGLIELPGRACVR